MLDNINILGNQDSVKPSPKPLVILTTRFKNPRLQTVTLNTAGEVSSIEGRFAIDVENTGFLPTRGTRITKANIVLKKDQSSVNIGEITEPVSLPNISPGETETIKIGFQRESTLINQLVNNVCSDNVVTGEVELTVAEVVLAATYNETVDLQVKESECQTLELEITGQNQVNLDQTYEWNVSSVDNQSISDVTWNMGDGTTKSGTNVQHEYTAEGDYTVTAEVPSGISTEIDVTAEALPLAVVGGTSPIVNQESTWTATGSVADNADTLTWAMGDGSQPKNGTSISHTYTTSGTYEIELSTDAGNTTSLEVSAEFPDVEVTINGNESVIFGESNSFSVVGSRLPQVEEFEWSMGDATIKNGRNITHSYDSGNAGGEATTYEVSVDAIIQDQSVASDTLTVNAGFSDITVELQDSRTVQSNQDVSFSATIGNQGDATNIIWSMGDGTTYEDANGDLGDDPSSVTHQYSNSSGGEPYEVTCEAYIDGNLINSATMAVTVNTFLI